LDGVVKAFLATWQVEQQLLILGMLNNFHFVILNPEPQNHKPTTSLGYFVSPCLVLKPFVFSFPFNYREYPCDHYTSVITVTLLMTGCPRVEVHATALQLLQILDKRFFGSVVGTLHSDTEKGMSFSF